MKHEPVQHDPHDEGYFASFTDMLVGILFIFIILLMIVANNYQEATESVTQMGQALEEARNEARDRQRDEARDAARDAARDQMRDAARDLARDEAHDRAVMQAQTVEQANAPEEMAASSEAKVINDDEIKRLRNSQMNVLNEARAHILKRIEQSMNMQGFPVVADVNAGILQVPENILFDANQGSVNYRGKQTLDVLAGMLTKYLPCISATKNKARLRECSGFDFSPNDGLDVIFIDDYPDFSGSREDKLLMAVHRTVSVFNELKSGEPYLDKELKNASGAPILNIKVNQKRREARNQDQNNPHLRKSVVLRFVMRTPNNRDIKKLRNAGPR